MQIVLFEDDASNNFHPLNALKPVYELTCGFKTLRDKFEAFFDNSLTINFHTRSYLSALYQSQNPDRSVNEVNHNDVIYINGRVLCNEAFAKFVLEDNVRKDTAYMNGAQLVAFRCNPNCLQTIGSSGSTSNQLIGLKSLPSHFKTAQVDCEMLTFLWDLIRLQKSEFYRDICLSEKIGQISGNVHDRATLVNPENIWIAEEAEISAGAVLDASQGAIVVDKGAKVLPNAVLMDNVYVGEKSTVKIGAKIYSNVSIGKQSKVGGEVEDSIFEAFSNKQHDGFIGHSYISNWCNLGADTNNSDLKNNYGSVRIKLHGQEFDTKMQFLGLFMGEHSKSGINTMFNTGTIVGVSSNIFGAGFPPKYIDSFEWGGAAGFQVYHLDKALEVARTVMKRRGIDMNSHYEKAFKEVYKLQFSL